MFELPNLRHLRAVALVARYQSVNGAAEALRLSQPAVTLAIRQVEKHCGSKLFNRYKTGTYPTAAGEALVLRIERCFAVLERGIIDTAEPSKEAPDYASRVSSSQITAVAVLFNLLDWSMASEVLGISVQSVKRTVRSLELLLQRSFLLQSGAGVVFSDDGKRIARAAKLAIREIELGTEELSILRGERSGTLRLGAMPLPRAQIVPEALSRLIEIYPDLRVHVQEGSYEYLLDLLRNGDIDMMVGALRGTESVPDVFEEFLMHCPLSVVARKGHPLQQKVELTLADTIDYQWIVNSPRSPSRSLFDQAFSTRGLPQPERLLEIGTLGVIRGLLLRGDQLTMLSRHQVHFEEEVGKLAILDVDLPETERPIGASTRIGWQPSRPQTEFMRQLKIVCDLPSEAERDGEQDHLRLVHDAQKRAQ
ncbi:LysR family transcriptional regulator (plasmid) [Roseibium aggregatum]|uniref:LysR substrate-binding domain-containing protein n=1 Tax=Roseibium aggregatum TaxID=187304 RepID=UPI001E521B88|nr:LysR substrate-binding domain-containing protein [Roseibium aggregatum]UES60059.1 LysR family transcriptional regulator [Roseibium aggregatum]